LTHRASRLLWGRSRLSHAQRVTHLAASQSRSFGVVRQRPLHPVREKGRTRIKALAKQPKTATFPGSWWAGHRTCLTQACLIQWWS